MLRDASRFLTALLAVSSMLLMSAACRPAQADINLTDEQLGPEVFPPGTYGPPTPNRDRFHYTVTAPHMGFNIWLKMWNPGHFPDNPQGPADLPEDFLMGRSSADIGDVGDSVHSDWIYVGGHINNYIVSSGWPHGAPCWYCGKLGAVVPNADSQYTQSTPQFYPNP